MLYTQYKDAALKHLNACKTALHGLKFYHGTTPLSQKKREALLHNIFYLSGYTLECVINYVIYKRVGWTTSPVKQMYNFSISIAFSKKPTEPRYPYPRLLYQGRPFEPQYFIEQHKFHRNIELLRTLLPNSRVPLIDNSIRISTNLRRMVFETQNQKNHWRPELRYETTTPFSESDIEEFVELTEQVYIQLLTVA